MVVMTVLTTEQNAGTGLAANGNMFWTFKAMRVVKSKIYEVDKAILLEKLTKTFQFYQYSYVGQHQCLGLKFF